MRPLHHVFVSSIVSGPETLVLPNLARLPQRPLVVVLRETRQPASESTVSGYARGLGLEVLEIPVSARFDLGAVGRLLRFWNETKPGIVHAHGPKASLHAALANRGRAAPERAFMVATHHGVRANDRALKTRLFEEVFERAVVPLCDLCLTVCTSDRRLLIRRGVAAAKLRVHLNGVDRKAVEPSERGRLRAALRRDWALACEARELDGFLIGVVGRLSVEKQHRRILSALARFAETDPEVPFRLLCFGSGPLENELRELTRSLPIAKRVHWMGYRKDVAAELAGLDLLLSLSNAEGLPINLIEAGWSGTPVVAQGVDGVRDLIEHGISGVLLEPPASDADVAAAIGRLARDGPAAAALGARLQERVRLRFSGSVWVSRLLDLYRLAEGTPADGTSPRPS